MSGKLRTKIGAIRQRLQRRLDFHVPFMEERKKMTGDDIRKMNDDQILEEIYYVDDTRQETLKEYLRLEKAHAQWAKMMEIDPTEKEIYATYVGKYGDFRVLLGEARTALDAADAYYSDLVAEATGRDLEIPSLSDDISVTTRSLSGTPAVPVDATAGRQEVQAGGAPGAGAPTTAATMTTHPAGTAAPAESTANNVRAPRVDIIVESAERKVEMPSQQSPSVTAPMSLEDQTARLSLERQMDPPRLPTHTHLLPPAPLPATTALSPSLFLQSALVGRAQLPTFNGDLVKWPPFKAAFLALLGDAVIPGCHKLALLKSCLTGEASQMISGLSQIDQDYDIAMSILHTEYDRPELIRHAIMTRIQAVPECDSSGKQLRRVYMEFRALIHQLCPEGEIDSPDFLVNVMITKLPTYLQTRIMKESRRKKVGVFSVLAMMQECVDDDRIEKLLTMPRSSNRPFPAVTAAAQPNHTSTVSTTRPSMKKNPPRRNERSVEPCRLCDGIHYVKDCDQFKTTSDKRIAVSQKRLCLNCLLPGHRVADCPSVSRCKKCSQKHHSTICTTADSSPTPAKPAGQQSHTRSDARPAHKQPSARPGPRPATNKHGTAKNVTNFVHSEEYYDDDGAAGDVTLRITTSPTPEDDSQAVLLCLDVLVSSPDRPQETTPVTLLFDTASNKSYVSKDLASNLDLPVLDQKMRTVFVFNTQKPINRVTTTSTLLITLPDGKQEPLTLQSANFVCPVIDWAQKKDGVLVPRRSRPTILLGMDYLRRFFLTAKLRTEILSDHFVVHTELGPCVSVEKLNSTGKFTTLTATEMGPSLPIDATTVSEEEDPVPGLWNLEPLGIFEKPTADSDTQCYDEFRKTIDYDETEKRYYVRLPIIDDPAKIPSNYNMAFARLRSNYNELNKNPALLEKYNNIFEEQLRAGIIEEVPPDEMAKESRVHYLPHHGVVKESSTTTKLRMVLDGSCHTRDSTSINDNLHRGPVLIPDLLGVLLRTRLPSILISGDVEKAFHAVGLHKDDRDFTRLLWVKDIRSPPSQSNLRVFRFKRVPFGLNSSPFLLSGTILHHLDATPSDYADVIRRMVYVDNVFMGAESEDECKKVYDDLRALFNSASMNLREFISNNKPFNEFVKNLGTGVDDFTKGKVLGVIWDPVTDRYSLARVPFPAADTVWTKRLILRFSAQYWDILGIISPVTMPLKRFIQTLWKNTYTWDEPLNDDHSSQWWKLLDQLDSVETISIPRMAIPRPIEGSMIELHCFCDASAAAYCAVIYTVIRRPDGSGIAHFLTSKVRISPKEPVPIPRLELLGNLMGALLTATVIRELDLRIDRLFLWTDSSICLHWITQPKTNLPVFIRNRIKQIREALPATTEYLHIDGKMNPADIGSRGCSAQELIDSPLWWHGPPFLTTTRADWPIKNILPAPTDVTLISATLTTELPVAPINLDHYSTWTRLLYTVRGILKFATRTSPRLREKFGESRTSLTKWSGIALFRLAQKQFPPNQYTQKMLHLIWNSTTGLWMRHTRTGADLVYLPRESRVTLLYVLQLHEEIAHAGMDHTLLRSRETVWIPKGRTTVKIIIAKECPLCSKTKAPPFPLPSFKDHPDYRLTPPLHPFAYIGMDMAGPLYYRTPGQAKEKYWILLITCLNSRNIHLDVVTDLTTKTLLNCIRRFVSVYGTPKSILADNFKSHSSLDDCLKIVLDPSTDPTMVDYCASHGIDFHYITPGAPWEGALYERMIGVVKKSLAASVGRSTYSLDDTVTTLKEIEAIVNSRPLSYVSADGEISPLRPVDFTRPHAKTSLPRLRGEKEPDDEWNPIKTSQQQLESAWKSTISCVNDFWNRWRSEYHSALQERYQETHPTPRSIALSKPREGDVVLIHDENLDRGQWRMGQLIGSKDDFTRSAIVRLPNGGSISRPINKLHKMEIVSRKIDRQPEPPEKIPEAPPEPTARRHPMMTRSRTGATALQLVTLACILATSLAMKCPSSSTEYSTSSLIHAPICAKEGAVITVQHTDSQMCWYPVKCPIGVITITDKMTIKCGPCVCPDWADGCAPSKSPLTSYSTSDHFPTEIANHRPADFCSSEPSPSCAKQPNTIAMAQVELFDHSTFTLPTLEIKTTDFVHSEDYICFTSNGNQINGPIDPPYDGTSLFCLHHSCTVNSEKFCAYDTPATQLISLVDRQPPLLIYAWGYRLFKYYPKKESARKPLTGNLECATGGGYLHVSEPATISACISSFCQYHPKIQNTTLFFPTEMIIRKYTMKVELQTADGRKTEVVKNCDSKPFCEAIRCWICLERLMNTHCHSFLDYLLAAAALLVMSLICICITAIWPIIYFITRLSHPIKWSYWFCYYLISSLIGRVRQVFTGTIVRLRRLFKRREEPILPTSVIPNRRPAQPIKWRNTASKTTALLTVVATTMMLQTVSACSETTTLLAAARDCTDKACVYSETTRLTLLPYGQQSCLAFDSDNSTNGFVSITVDDLVYRCHKRSLYFTRDHRIDVTSNRRCSSRGACVGSKCDAVKHDSILSDLPSFANDAPGYTFCAASPGALWNGCGLMDSSCLFYRIYASPQSSTVHEVFTCPTWDPVVKITVSFKTSQEDETTSLTLSPGSTVSWKSFKLTLSSLTTPILPVLSSEFITDGSTTAMLTGLSKSEPTPNSPSQLMCPTREDATNFRCKFGIESCKCSTGEDNASCTCPDGKCDRYYKDRLPIVHSNVKVSHDQSTITAKLSVGSALELQLTTAELQLSSYSHEETVDITSSPLVGCYSCVTGATTTLTCRSHLHVVNTPVVCNSSPIGIVKCTPIGHATDIVINENTPTVNLHCFAGREGDNVTFVIKGQLFYAPSMSLSSVYNTSSYAAYVPTEPSQLFSSFLDSISNVFSILTFPFTHPITMTVIIIIVLLILIALRNRLHLISTKTD